MYNIELVDQLYQYTRAFTIGYYKRVCTLGMGSLLPGQTTGHPLSSSFERIEVHPYYQLFHPSITDLKGGPNWPNFYDRTFERHNRNGSPIDIQPAEQTSRLPRLKGKHVWVGPVLDHFGHQILDFSNRISQAKALSPNSRFLISTQTSNLSESLNRPSNNWHYPDIQSIPLYVLNILAWFGVPADSLTLVTTPVEVDELEVFEQGEQFLVPPANWYLDALNSTMQGKAPIPSERIYVSRVKLKSPFGNFLGEKYLEMAFANSGFQILHPETLPVSVQARIYAGAKQIVFAEGSAIHGIGLLGNLDAEVIVIERRISEFTLNVFANSISPRVKTFNSVRAIDFCFPDDSHWRSLTVLNPTTLIEILRSFGVDLRKSFVQVDYWNSVYKGLENIHTKILDNEHYLPDIYSAHGTNINEVFKDHMKQIKQQMMRGN